MTDGEKQVSPNPSIGYTIEYKSSRKDVWKRYWLMHPFVYICKPKTKKNSLFQYDTLGGDQQLLWELEDYLRELPKLVRA